MYVAATAPKMQALAGEIGDGCLTPSITTPAFVRYTRDNVKADIDIGCTVVASIGEDRDDGRDGAREIAGMYLANKVQNIKGAADTLLDLADIDVEEIRPVAEAMERGGRLAAKEQVTDSILDRCKPIAGTPSDCIAAIEEYRDAGCTHVMLELWGAKRHEQIRLFAREGAAALPLVSRSTRTVEVGGLAAGGGRAAPRRRRVPWYVAAGWALDLFLGGGHREHEDLEIAVPNSALRRGRGRARRPRDLPHHGPDRGDAARGGARPIRRHAPDLGARAGDGVLALRRLPRAVRRRHVDLPARADAPDAVRAADRVDGRRHSLRPPEVVLLFKAKHAPGEEPARLRRDAAAARRRAARWLRDALARVHPGHGGWTQL